MSKEAPNGFRGKQAIAPFRRHMFNSCAASEVLPFWNISCNFLLSREGNGRLISRASEFQSFCHWTSELEHRKRYEGTTEGGHEWTRSRMDWLSRWDSQFILSIWGCEWALGSANWELESQTKQNVNEFRRGVGDIGWNPIGAIGLPNWRASRLSVLVQQRLIDRAHLTIH